MNRVLKYPTGYKIGKYIRTEASRGEAVKKEGKTLNPIVILVSVVILCTIASYFVLPGIFDRTQLDGRAVVVAGSYHPVGKTPIGIFEMFRAIPEGLVASGSLIWLVLLVGGALKVYTESGSLDKGIFRFLKLSNKVGSQVVRQLLSLLFLRSSAMKRVECGPVCSGIKRPKKYRQLHFLLMRHILYSMRRRELSE